MIIECFIQNYMKNLYLYHTICHTVKLRFRFVMKDNLLFAPHWLKMLHLKNKMMSLEINNYIYIIQLEIKN